LLLIEETPDHRERFVSGLQILRLYKGAAQRLESARNSGGDRRHDSPVASVLANVPAVSENPGCGQYQPSGPRSPPAPDSARLKNVRVQRPPGLAGPEPPPDDGMLCQGTPKTNARQMGAQTPPETSAS
jgi:hypothetical protein